MNNLERQSTWQGTTGKTSGGQATGGLEHYAQGSGAQSAAMTVPLVILEQELHDPISLGGKLRGILKLNRLA